MITESFFSNDTANGGAGGGFHAADNSAISIDGVRISSCYANIGAGLSYEGVSINYNPFGKTYTRMLD